MIFELTAETAWASNRFFAQVCSVIERPLREFLDTRTYGNSVNIFVVSARILPLPILETFKKRGGLTRYSPKIKTIFVVREIDYDSFVSADADKCVAIMLEFILMAISQSDSMLRKPKEFDKEALYQDVRQFIDERGWKLLEEVTS